MLQLFHGGSLPLQNVKHSTSPREIYFSWKKKGNSLLYFLITPLCVKVNCNVSLQLTFTQFGVRINSMQNGVNFYTKWCNPRLLVATANFAVATACSVTRRSLHGPGSNFCHPPAHGAEIYAFKIESLWNLINEFALEKKYTFWCKSTQFGVITPFGVKTK